MYSLLGSLRMAAMALVLLVGVTLITLISFLPIQNQVRHLPGWITTYMARLFTHIYNVTFTCTRPERLRQQKGFLFPNHCSYLDIIAMLYLMPVRFLAAIEVERRPVIGRLATAIGCVYVTRTQQASRHVARSQIVKALQRSLSPPLVIYPEGRLGPGSVLYSFRYGAFEMAVENGIPFLPVALRYTPRDLVVWHGPRGESMLAAVWRLAKFPGPVHVEVIPLAPIVPDPHVDPHALALATQSAIAEALGMNVVEPPSQNQNGSDS